jgi:hypothetical protein
MWCRPTARTGTAGLLDRFCNFKQVAGRARQPVKLADDNRIAFPKMIEHALKLWPGCRELRY